MGSRKRSARAKEIANLEASWSDAGIDDLFAREEARHGKIAEKRDETRRTKACDSKNRYPTHADAEAARTDCARHGTTGLEIYRCPYCNGWHLTSHPWKD